MDFIQENDGGFSILKIEFCLIDKFEQIFFFACHTGQIEKIRLDGLRDDMCYSGLAASRRTSENHGGDFI